LAEGVNIHYHGNGPWFIPESPDELRVNHYKKKDDGVYNMFRKWLCGSATRLGEDYRNRIVERLALIREEAPYRTW